MFTVMDTSTGKLIADKEGGDDGFGAFRDQVLNAEWVPRPELRLQSIQVRSSTHPKLSLGMDVEAFLAAMYCNQR